MSLKHPGLRLVVALRAWAQRVVESSKEQPELLGYLLNATDRRRHSVPFEGPERRRTISLNYLTHYAANEGGPPDAAA